jgi:replication-associated recombination protein RarA
MTDRFNVTTRSGHPLGEVASAFQKSIRRGLADEALHWGVELDVSNFGEYAWKRLRIIASEDVGLAEPYLPATIFALYQNWLDQRKKRDLKHGPERLFLVHAILLLVRAKKSRIVDHALITYYGNHERRDIPDYALDKHTGAGRRLGRGVAHFFDEGIHLENMADMDDPYRESARNTMLKDEDNNAFSPGSLFDELE